MKFKSIEEPQPTDDFWYDVFKGGYIKPEDFLEDPEDIQKVREAIRVLEEFERGLYDNELIEDM